MAGSNKEYRTGWTWDPPAPGWYRTRRTGGELWYRDGAKWADLLFLPMPGKIPTDPVTRDTLACSTDRARLPATGGITDAR